jgi:Enoyl-(Acyl carrier protein) reductase
MIPQVKAKLLDGKKGLIVGIANENSIAWGCAKAFRAFGAEVPVTYLNEKARKYVEPLARELEAPIVMPLDVGMPGQMEAVFQRITKDWASSISSSTPSRFLRRRRCKGVSSTCHGTAFSPPWTCRAGSSSAWPLSPSP